MNPQINIETSNSTTPMSTTTQPNTPTTTKKTYLNSRPHIQFRGERFQEQNVLPNDERLKYQPIQWVFGYRNLQYISPTTGQWTRLSPDDDKFLVYATSLKEAKDEFYSRWSLYIHARFGIRFARID
jgi:hypothetical protein